jgi:hypothetical protein
MVKCSILVQGRRLLQTFLSKSNTIVQQRFVAFELRSSVSMLFVDSHSSLQVALPFPSKPVESFPA